MKFNFLLICLAATVAFWGCKVTVGDGIDDDGGTSSDIDADTDSDADSDSDSDSDVDTDGIATALTWAWTIVDTEDNPLSCEEASAAYAMLAIIDSEGTEHDIMYWDCAPGTGYVDGLAIASGPASVRFELLTGEPDTLSYLDGDDIFVNGDETANDLGSVEFTVNLYDPTLDANASVEWYWMFGEDEEDAVEPDEQMCADAGIDYTYLWVWNPVTESWWGSSEWTEFPCEMYDHGDGLAPWAGLHIDDFLVAGDYQLFLGFYAEAEDETSADVLMYQDTRGTAEAGYPIVADEETEDGYNVLGTTILDATLINTGMLKIALTWQQSEGGSFDSCDDSNVDTMGFLLRNDGWVAAEVPLDDGVGCLNGLNFTDVPILEQPYELLVSALSTESELLWHNICQGLIPEEVATLEEAMGYECIIANQLNE